MNVLVVAPHPDDEVIGCGGTLCLRTARGDRATVVFLTSGELGLKHLPRQQAWHVREAEAEAAAEVLGLSRVTFLRHPDQFVDVNVAAVASSLRAVLAREEPQVIYLPHAGDGHPDHQAAVPVLRTALTDHPCPEPAVLVYEVWTPLSEYDHVEDIGSVMPRKLRALRCYASQLEYLRYDQAVRGLNAYRGALAARCRYAEVFLHQQLNGKPPGGDMA